jgi:hypothetical protein
VEDKVKSAQCAGFALAVLAGASFLLGKRLKRKLGVLRMVMMASMRSTLLRTVVLALKLIPQKWP